MSIEVPSGGGRAGGPPLRVGRPGWHVARGLLVAGLYLAAAALGLQLAFVGSNVSLLWIPTGIAVAGLLLWGAPILGALVPTVMVVHLWLGAPHWAAAFMGLGSSGGYGLASRLMARSGLAPDFRSTDDFRTLGVLLTSTTRSAYTTQAIVAMFVLQLATTAGAAWLGMLGAWTALMAVALAVAVPAALGVGAFVRLQAEEGEWVAWLFLLIATLLAVLTPEPRRRWSRSSSRSPTTSASRRPSGASASSSRWCSRPPARASGTMIWRAGARSIRTRT